jgi:hypothetical protein
VLVELRHAGNTVSGQVAVEGASPIGFFGWLELIDRLERAAGGEERSALSESRDERRPSR